MYVHKSVVAVVLVLLAVEYTLAEETHNRVERGTRGRRGKDKKSERCSDWIFTECIAANNKCGQGTKLGNRDGEKCRIKQKTFVCQLPCPTTEVTTEELVPAAEDDDVIMMTKMSKRDRKKGSKERKRKVCRYKKGDWSSCDETTDKMTRTLTLKRGADSCERAKTQSKRCKAKKEEKSTSKNCKYETTRIHSCDTTSDTQLVTLTVKSGSPSSCAPTKEITKKCKRTCVYTPGTWTDCDPDSHMKSRVDKLKSKSMGMDCKEERTVTKLCRPKKNMCKYQRGTWSDNCNSEGKRVLTRTLQSGNPEKCAPVKTVEKSCTSKNGKERCFFGPWGEWGTCQNGVQTKIRPVVEGDDECQRKAVKTKPCATK